MKRWTGVLIRYLLPPAVIYFLPFLYPNRFFVDVLQQVGYTWILVQGLNLLVGYSGQVSLGQVGFFGLGAYTSALLAKHLHLPVPLTMLAGVAAATLFGAVVGLLALRVKGLYLAMVTIATGSVVEILANRWTALTGGPMGVHDIPRVLPGIGPVEFYWLVGFAGFLVHLGVSNIMRSRYGRTFLAVKNSEVAARSVGVNVFLWKVGAFVLCAALGGLAGAFFAHQNTVMTSESFTYDVSVRSLVAVILGGTGTAWGPLVGAALVVGIPTFFRQLYDYFLLIYGGSLLLTLLALPDGIMGALLRLWHRAFGKAPDRTPRAGRGPLPAWLRRPGGAGGVLLATRGLSKHFQGLKALSDLDLSVAAGQVHGLIGPNGSGKSTTINVLTGVYAPTHGTIHLGGRDVTSLSTHELARTGVTRTFQNIQLFTDLTVLENVLMGFHRHLRTGFLSHLLQLPAARREEETYRARAMELLEFVGLAHLAGEQAKNLSYGQQRLLEIARALATEPELLLLDEPAAGLNQVEVEHMTEFVREIARSGITLVVVEHHMEMVMELCDRITVLNFGAKIAEGSPEQVRQDKQVIEAYLGGDDVLALLTGGATQVAGD